MNMLWWAKRPRARRDIFKNKKAIREFKDYLLLHVGKEIISQCFNYNEMKDFCNLINFSKILSVKNTYPWGQKVKVITIFGFKIRIKTGKRKNLPEFDDYMNEEKQEAV